MNDTIKKTTFNMTESARTVIAEHQRQGESQTAVLHRILNSWHCLDPDTRINGEFQWRAQQESRTG